MIRSILALVLGFATSLLAACAGSGGAGAPADPSTLLGSLSGTEWVAQNIDGSPSTPGVRSTLRFESADHVSGDSGCNQFTGPMKVEGKGVHVGPLAMTRRACADPAMQQEHRYARALEHTRELRKDGDALLLVDGSGGVVVRLSRLTSTTSR
jgi:heat shock protein HslJ